MNVRDFTEATRLQIVEGTNAASTAIRDTRAKISSKNVSPLHEGTTHDTETGNLVNLIEFDIAVTVNEIDRAEGRAGISIAGIGFGSSVGVESNNQTVSRIKFSIPMPFPAI